MAYLQKLLFLICFIIPCFVFAQSSKQDVYLNNESTRFFGALVAGANFTQVDGDTYSGYNKVGLNAGAMVYTRLSSIMGGSLEFDYTQKGSHGVSSTASAALGSYISDYRLKLNYVEVPVILHILTNRRLHYEVGASYARLLNSSETLYSDPGTVIDPNIFYFRKTDVSFIAGLCYQFYNWWSIEGRYQYSLATIRDQERIPVGGPRQFNNVCTIRLVRFLNKVQKS
jgi:hypothetical protein